MHPAAPGSSRRGRPGRAQPEHLAKFAHHVVNGALTEARLWQSGCGRRVQRRVPAVTVAVVDVIIFDLAALRYRWNEARTALSMFSPLREQLALVSPAPGTADREAATLACDQALDVCRLRRAATEADGSPTKVRYKIALYNPYTAKVAIGAVPHNQSFGDFAPLAIPPGGLPARLEDAGPVLLVGERALALSQPTVAELTRELAAHRP